MSEVLSIMGDSNVNHHLNQAKAANPADNLIRQSHLVTAFNGEQLHSSMVTNVIKHFAAMSFGRKTLGRMLFG